MADFENFRYWVAGIVATMLHGREVNCSEQETSIFDAPAGQTCGEYLAAYFQQAPGTLQNPSATTGCRVCPISSADQYLAGPNIYWADRWRNFGLMWVYVFFNIAVATFLYYFFRVRKSSGKSSSIFQKMGTGLKVLTDKTWKKKHSSA